MIVITTPTASSATRSSTTCSIATRSSVSSPGPVGSERRARRVEVIEGSHGDAGVVDKAFAGADAVFWLVPPDPRAPSVEAAFVGFTRPAAEAFTKHDVGRVVGVRRSAGARHGPTRPATSPARWRWTT